MTNGVGGVVVVKQRPLLSYVCPRVM